MTTNSDSCQWELVKFVEEDRLGTNHLVVETSMFTCIMPLNMNYEETPVGGESYCPSTAFELPQKHLVSHYGK